MPAARAEGPKKRLLVYTRSQGFQHSTVTRKGDKLSLAEQTVTGPDGNVHRFEIHAVRRKCLLEGLETAAVKTPERGLIGRRVGGSEEIISGARRHQQ